MGFLRKKVKRSNRNASVSNGIDRTGIPKTNAIMKLFGSSKKKESIEESIPRAEASKMIFQHVFQTVDGEEIAHANNVTVDSIETIMDPTLEEEPNDSYQVQPLTISVIDDGAPRDDLKVEQIIQLKTREMQFCNELEEFPEEEPISIGKIAVVEQQWQQDVHEDDQKKEEIEVQQLNENNDRFIHEYDDDDDVCKDNNRAKDSATDVQSSTQTDSISNNAQNPVERAAGAFVQALGCSGQNVRNFISLPEKLSRIAMPAMACKPIINRHAATEAYGRPERNSLTEFYDDSFARKFLNVRIVDSLRSTR
jgi:hypothetical protein